MTELFSLLAFDPYGVPVLPGLAIDINEATGLAQQAQVNAAAIALIEACEPLSTDDSISNADLISTDTVREQVQENFVLVNYGVVLCQLYNNRFLLESTKHRMKPIIKIVAEDILATITYPSSLRPTDQSVRIDLTGPYGILLSEEEVSQIVTQKQAVWDTRQQDMTQYLAQFYNVRDILEDFVPSISEHIAAKFQEYHRSFEYEQVPD